MNVVMSSIPATPDKTPPASRPRETSSPKGWRNSPGMAEAEVELEEEAGDTADARIKAEAAARTKAEAERIAAEAATVAGLDWVPEEKVSVSWNTILRVGTWNVRSLSNSDRSSGGEQAQRDVMSDLGAQQLALVAVQECRWERQTHGRIYVVWGRRLEELKRST